jgi:hypothetical protein
MLMTFSAQDVNLASFPHTNAMVVTVHIDRWDVTKILIDNRSQAKILFLTTFEKMGYDQKQLKEPTKLLYGFGGKRIEPVGVIILPVLFGTPKNPRTEYITFNVVNMLYPYNTIFGRGLLNTFEAALHSGYLCHKIPATFELYQFLAVTKMLEISRRASCLVTKTYIFCEKSQSNATPTSATSKPL